MVSKRILLWKVQKDMITKISQSLNNAYFKDILVCSKAFIPDSKLVCLVFMNRNMNLPHDSSGVRNRLFSVVFKTARQTGIADTDIQIVKEISVRTIPIRNYSQDAYKMFASQLPIRKTCYQVALEKTYLLSS